MTLPKQPALPESLRHPPCRPAAAAPPAAPAAVVAVVAVSWRDETPVTLEPGAGIEIKLSMKEGDKALFDWAVQGGVVNFDTHGESFPRSISYEKGRGVAAKQGELVAAFDGKHGWFFRNRGAAPVTVAVEDRRYLLEDRPLTSCGAQDRRSPGSCRAIEGMITSETTRPALIPLAAPVEKSIP